jgi:hypothetical protein
LPVLAARTTPSWLGLRSGGAPAAARREHGLGGGITSSLLRYSLQRELRKLQRSHSVRFGTSCLMVAVKPR